MATATTLTTCRAKVELLRGPIRQAILWSVPAANGSNLSVIHMDQGARLSSTYSMMLLMVALLT